jgi:hypothetical protein
MSEGLPISLGHQDVEQATDFVKLTEYDWDDPFALIYIIKIEEPGEGGEVKVRYFRAFEQQIMDLIKIQRDSRVEYLEVVARSTHTDNPRDIDFVISYVNNNEDEFLARLKKYFG